MLTNPQKAKIKQGQRQARLSDEEYREVLKTVAGVDSSTAKRLGNEAFDAILGYMEAIYWRKVDTGEIEHKAGPRAAFTERGFWSGRNSKTAGNSRDRWARNQAGKSIEEVRKEMLAEGVSPAYIAAIEEKAGRNASGPKRTYNQRAALTRTLEAHRKKHASNCPF